MEDIYLVEKYLPSFPESSILPTYIEVFRKFMFQLRAEKQVLRLSAISKITALEMLWSKKILTL